MPNLATFRQALNACCATLKAEPDPPWIVCPQAVPGDYYWREAGEVYWHSTWMPFWQSMDAEACSIYLARSGTPKDWQEYLTHFEAWSAELERIDAEDIAAGVLQPNGGPWPEQEPSPNKSLRPWHWIVGLCVIALLAGLLATL